MSFRNLHKHCFLAQWISEEGSRVLQAKFKSKTLNTLDAEGVKGMKGILTMAHFMTPLNQRHPATLFAHRLLFSLGD
jgi:hypothetical protein